MRSEPLPRCGIPVTLSSGVLGVRRSGAATPISEIQEQHDAYNQRAYRPAPTLSDGYARPPAIASPTPPSSSSNYSLPAAMPSFTKQTTTRALATSTAIKNVAPTRNLYQSCRSNSSSATDSGSCREGDLSTKLSSDTNSDPDTEADGDIEPGTSEDAGLAVENYSDPNLDSEAEEILKDIAQLKAEGPAKPNHTKHTTKLWKRADLSTNKPSQPRAPA
jgi:hypothetical protein